MVLMGWLLTGFWGRNDDRPETFPDFDFDNFGKNLERGLWPTLVVRRRALVLVTRDRRIIIVVGMFVWEERRRQGSDNAGWWARVRGNAHRLAL